MGVGGGERDNAELGEGAEYAQKRMARVSTTEATEGTKQEQGDYPANGLCLGGTGSVEVLAPSLSDGSRMTIIPVQVSGPGA